MSSHRKQLASLLTGQMLSLALSFVVPLILARLLTTNDYGLYSQFNVVLSFCTTFFAFGLSSELYYSYPTAPSELRRILISQCYVMLTIMGLIAGLMLALPFVKNYITEDPVFSDNYIFLILSVIISVPEVIITVLYVLNNDHKVSATFLPVSTIVRVLLIFLLYHVDPSIKSLFLAIFLSTLLKYIFILVYSIGLVKKNNGEKYFDKQIFINQLKYSLPLGFASSTRILLQQVDKMILLGFITPSAYAIYAIAFYGVPGLTQVYSSISQVYIPRMVIAHKNSDRYQVKALYHSMVSKTLSYTIPLILVIILFADPIVPFVFSSKYIASIPYFRIYLITFIIGAVGCGNMLRVTGETKKSLYAYLYSAIFIIPFTYFSIKYYSLNGAIVSAVLGNILPKIILSRYDMKALSVSLFDLYPWKVIFKQIAISCIALVPFVFLYLTCAIHFWSAVCCLIVYLGVVSILEMCFGVFIISFDDLKSYICRIIKK